MTVRPRFGNMGRCPRAAPRSWSSSSRWVRWRCRQRSKPQTRRGSGSSTGSRPRSIVASARLEAVAEIELTNRGTTPHPPRRPVARAAGPRLPRDRPRGHRRWLGGGRRVDHVDQPARPARCPWWWRDDGGARAVHASIARSPDAFGARTSAENGVLSFGQWFPIVSTEHEVYGIGDPQISYTAESVRFELTTTTALPRDAVACPGLVEAPEVSGTAWTCESDPGARLQLRGQPALPPHAAGGRRRRPARVHRDRGRWHDGDAGVGARSPAWPMRSAPIRGTTSFSPR